MKPQSKRAQLDILRTQLESERSSFLPHYRDLAEHVRPRRPRFTVSDVNRGDRRSQKIIDGTATYALRTCSSGMMGGITSPSRPWFRLTTPDPDLSEFGPVDRWLDIVTRRMGGVFLRSNLYNVLPNTYTDLPLFGTGCQLLEEDFDTVIRNTSIPIGSYCIANSDKLKVEVFYRELRMTVRQLIEKFARIGRNGEPDWSNFSTMIRASWDQGAYETWVDVCHMILPNQEHDARNPLSKKYESLYYERGSSSAASNYLTSSDEERYLRKSGYDIFPVLAPRWEVTGEDVYGISCPGMDALGDIKQLQLMQRRKAQAVEKMVNPPLQGPPELRNQRVSIIPGDMNYVASQQGQQGLRPVHEVQPRVQELMLDIQDTRQSIRRAFYEDLFLMLSQSDRREITAREIEERHEEKLLALGPVLEQLNQDLLDPLIDNTFHFMIKQGLIPEPPPELEGMDLKVEYVSIMAQAQKLVGIASTERFVGFVGNLAQFSPEALDNINPDELVADYADRVGISPKILRTEDEVAAVRQSRAQAAQQQQMMEVAPSLAGAAKDLSETPVDTDSALRRLIGA